jgi:hypothetical protein
VIFECRDVPARRDVARPHDANSDRHIRLET